MSNQVKDLLHYERFPCNNPIYYISVVTVEITRGTTLYERLLLQHHHY